MTLNDLMTLDDREIDEHVGRFLGLWSELEDEGGVWREHWWGWNDATKSWKVHGSVALGRILAHACYYDSLPRFSSQWDAAMLIRDWVQERDAEYRRQFVNRLARIIFDRMGVTESYVLLCMEPRDYCLALLTGDSHA